MSDSQTEVVKAEITRAVAKMRPDRLANSSAIASNQDLLEFVDSFGFVQLLMSIEEPLGVELDLTGIDLGSIVRFEDLTAFVLKNIDNPSLAKAG